MKTTERFERAITKLYKAFHEGTLNAMSCSQCAVGNICNNQPYWARITNNSNQDNFVHESLFLDRVNEFLSRCNVGYSPIEIATIEKIFLIGVGYTFPWDDDHNNWQYLKQTKDNQFKGLCAVVEYLCKLDGIPNVMDYSSLFEYDDLGAVNQLETVFP